MTDRINLAEMRADLAAGERSPLWADFAPTPSEVRALLDVVEAAHQAAIMSYDPRATTAQNGEYNRRARHLNAALARFDFGDTA